MGTKIRVLAGVLMVMTLPVGTVPVFAADKPGQDQSKRLQQQLRTAEREKAQLTAKKAEVDAQLKEAQDALAEAKRKSETATRRTSTLTRNLDALTAEKESLQASLTERSQAFAGEQRKVVDLERRIAEAARLAEAQGRAATMEKQRLNVAIVELQSALNASRERNERMYKLGFELIDRYESKAVFWSDPFTQIGRAKIEKMAEEDRDKFDKERLPPVVLEPRLEGGRAN
jgi:chromosome segregation ATPase